MSTLPPRSSTGCLTCKCRRKKCDETKPQCLRCQKSGLECPGYVYIQSKNKRTKKLRTLPAPREKKAKARAPDTDQQHSSSSSAELSALGPAQDYAGSMEISTELLDFPSLPNLMGSLYDLDTWPNAIQENVFYGSHFTPTIGQDWNPPSDSSSLLPPTGSTVSMTSGQASLFNALFSLSNAQDLSTFSSNDTTPASGSTPLLLTEPSWPTPDTEEDDSSSEEELEEANQIICRPLTLDKNAESNALPFVLQNYATWVARMAYEPLKLAGFIREFVVKQFEDGQESRWILTLLANIGGRLGRGMMIDGAHFAMISTLQSQVRRRLANAKSIADDEIGRRESVKALDAALETIIIHIYSSPVSDWITLREEAAPLFRRLCPEPPGSPINLPSLLHQPHISLRHYVHIDVLCATLMDIPMFFRYDCAPQSLQPICEPVGETQIDSGAQWLHGTPDRFVAMFSKINAMREDGWVPTPEMVAVFEHGIQEFQPTQSKSRDSFLSVTRLVVQECWRQVAYVYLYMGLCGDSSNTPRVKKALKQFMKLLNGTKPGRMPDQFLVMNIILIAPAAQKKSDRETLRNRIQRLKVNGTKHGVNDKMSIVENYWAHVDAEGRAIMWSDIAQARRRVVGI